MQQGIATSRFQWIQHEIPTSSDRIGADTPLALRCARPDRQASRRPRTSGPRTSQANPITGVLIPSLIKHSKKRNSPTHVKYYSIEANYVRDRGKGVERCRRKATGLRNPFYGGWATRMRTIFFILTNISSLPAINVIYPPMLDSCLQGVCDRPTQVLAS